MISKMLVFMMEGRAAGITCAGHSVMQDDWSINLAALPIQRAATIPAVLNLHYLSCLQIACARSKALRGPMSAPHNRVHSPRGNILRLLIVPPSMIPTQLGG